MDNYLERGQRLYNMGRFQDAEQEFKKVLAEEPNHAFALALMSLVYLETDRRTEALALSQMALGQAPWSPFIFYVLARVQFFNQQIKEALETVKQGRNIDPEDPDFFILEAQIYFHQSKWEEALAAAASGMELDPENVQLINLRAQSLVKLNRKAEAAQTLDYALQKAPENSYSHANKGWVSIERDSYDEAVNSFKEALRLDATNEYAKDGLKEAIKGSNILYRGILKYFLWMSRLAEKGRWAFIIGAYIAYQLILRMAEAYPSIAPLLYPLIVFYIIFAFSTWIARPISNLFLRFHRLGKLALTEDEILASNIAGILAVSAIGCLTIYHFTDGILFLLLGAFLGLMLIPMGGVFGMPEGSKPRQYLMIYSTVLAVVGMGFIAFPNMGFLALIF
ncbi:MAG: tetratricopeptide (TPR) repeat protein, partial [Saprospiraceae bacterium]